MLVFLNNIAAATFGENSIDPVGSSEYLNNACAMALTYRFLPSLFEGGNAAQNIPRFDRLISMLDSAPNSFPMGLAISSPWNQNFRWMRDKSEDSAAQLYGGMDYMVPLMLVASKPTDIDANREVLREALAPKFQQEEDMGIFKLPFQGPSNGETDVFLLNVTNTQQDTLLYVGVGWERGRGDGKVTVTWKGASQPTEFLEKEPSKMVTIPMQDIRATITGNSKGYFMIQSFR
jgi:hypothetical protein